MTKPKKADRFDTITADDWKRSLARARSTPNAVRAQIQAANPSSINATAAVPPRKP